MFIQRLVDSPQLSMQITAANDSRLATVPLIGAKQSKTPARPLQFSVRN